MNEFCEKVAEVLEVESINASDEFRVVTEYWDSMMGFSMLVMIENEYNVRISVDEFLKCKSVRDLYDRIKEVD